MKFTITISGENFNEIFMLAKFPEILLFYTSLPAGQDRAAAAAWAADETARHATW